MNDICERCEEVMFVARRISSMGGMDYVVVLSYDFVSVSALVSGFIAGGVGVVLSFS